MSRKKAETTVDAEIAAIGAVVAILAPLEDEQRERVMRYISGRFIPRTPVPWSPTPAVGAQTNGDPTS